MDVGAGGMCICFVFGKRVSKNVLFWNPMWYLSGASEIQELLR